jgi:hypothetical protein
MVVHPAAGYVSREEPRRRRTTDEAPSRVCDDQAGYVGDGPEGVIRELFRRFADRICVYCVENVEKRSSRRLLSSSSKGGLEPGWPYQNFSPSHYGLYGRSVCTILVAY